MRLVQTALICLGGVAALVAAAGADDAHLAEGGDLAEIDEPDIDLVDFDGHDFDPDRTIETGFLFIDGAFVAPPYRIRLSDDGRQVLVNGREVPRAIPHFPSGSREERPARRERDGRRAGWRARGDEPPRHLWAGRLRQHLDADAAIVAFTGQRMRILNSSGTYMLFKTLLEPDPRSDHFAEAMEIPDGPEATATWRQWLLSFQADPALRRKIEPYVEEFEVAEAANMAQIAAVRRFDAVAYPLTLLGMMMSVVAFGHLLMSLPNNDAMRRGAPEGEGVISREVIRATMISVVLVAALSSLDLVWTLLASQAGQMRELNPIASHFINDPLSLIAFKATATLLGCGLLYALRQHSRAQLASWWMCLVCTMLTFRWLMFNSLFVT